MIFLSWIVTKKNTRCTTKRSRIVIFFSLGMALTRAGTFSVCILRHSLLAFGFSVTPKCSPSLCTFPMAKQYSHTSSHFLLNSILVMSLGTPNISTTRLIGSLRAQGWLEASTGDKDDVQVPWRKDGVEKNIHRLTVLCRVEKGSQENAVRLARCVYHIHPSCHKTPRLLRL